MRSFRVYKGGNSENAPFVVFASFCAQKEDLVHHRLKIEFADSLRNAFSRRSSRSGRARTSRRYPAYHEDMDCRMPDDETMQRMAEEYDRALRKSGCRAGALALSPALRFGV